MMTSNFLHLDLIKRVQKWWKSKSELNNLKVSVWLLDSQTDIFHLESDSSYKIIYLQFLLFPDQKAQSGDFVL